MASKSDKKKKKEKVIQLSELVAIEKALQKKYSKVVNSVLSFVKKEGKKGKMKVLASRLSILEDKLINVDQAIQVQAKKEKKAVKKKEKKEKKSGKTTLKGIKSGNETTKKPVVKEKPSVSNSSEKSTDFNAKQAISELQKLNTKEEVQGFIKGDQRVTVLARAKSRINALV